MSKKTELEFTFSSQTNEWFTPDKYLILIRHLFADGIELDPASCAEANEAVRARRFFSIEDDGLKKDWRAKTLFLNPPYGKTGNRSNAGIWAHKLIEEFRAGRCQEAVLLINASTSETWFRPLYDFPICFTYERIKFKPPKSRTDKSQPTKGNCFIYFGSRLADFSAAFDSIGCVMRRNAP